MVLAFVHFDSQQHNIPYSDTIACTHQVVQAVLLDVNGTLNIAILQLISIEPGRIRNPRLFSDMCLITQLSANA